MNKYCIWHEWATTTLTPAQTTVTVEWYTDLSFTDFVNMIQMNGGTFFNGIPESIPPYWIPINRIIRIELIKEG